MKRSEMIELYITISAIFAGDYTPEMEYLLENDERFEDDDAYVNALMDIFEKDNVLFEDYVGCAACFFENMFECHMDEEDATPQDYLKRTSPEEYDILKRYDFFDGELAKRYKNMGSERPDWWLHRDLPLQERRELAKDLKFVGLETAYEWLFRDE